MLGHSVLFRLFLPKNGMVWTTYIVILNNESNDGIAGCVVEPEWWELRALWWEQLPIWVLEGQLTYLPLSHIDSFIHKHLRFSYLYSSNLPPSFLVFVVVIACGDVLRLQLAYSRCANLLGRVLTKERLVRHTVLFSPLPLTVDAPVAFLLLFCHVTRRRHAP